MNRVTRFLLFVFVMLFVAAPVTLAQEGGGIIVEETGNPLILNVLGIVASILLVGIVAGAFIVTHKALSNTRDLVPPEVLNQIGGQIVTAIQGTIDSLTQRAEQTDTPIDDSVVGLARIPLDQIVRYLEAQGLGIVHKSIMATDQQLYDQLKPAEIVGEGSDNAPE